MIESAAPSFAVITGEQVGKVLHGQEQQVMRIVADTYRLHGAGHTVNPPSYFLRFPDRPADRIIALPASLGGDSTVDGIKWISSFPGNVAAGLPRASGVIVLNDPANGYPFACLETSVISATRTAASAAVAAGVLLRAGPGAPRVGFAGTGLIARYVHTYLQAAGWDMAEVGVYDTMPAHADGFSSYVARSGGRARVHTDPGELVRASDVVVFATVASTPHVHDPSWFRHNPLVLHLSLRDLAPEIILSSINVVDDVDHCLRANTSPHLAEQQAGHRDFVHAELPEVLTGTAVLPAGGPVVFSPFGLGVLDLALARYVHEQLDAGGELRTVPGFFDELDRYGARS
jgi:2,3-diaminopropionate biosynthesis protein SbnB